MSDATAWAMVDASPDGLVLVNGDGVIELVNQQAEALFGFDRVEMLGRPVEMLLPENIAALHRAHRTRYRAAPEVRAMGEGMDLWARRADGSEIPVEISLSPIELDGRGLVLAAVRDITTRVAAAAKTRRLQRAVDRVGDAVAMIDPDTMQFVYANRGMSLLTGYAIDEIVTMTPMHFDPVFTKAETQEFFNQLIDGTTDQVRMETTLRPRSGIDIPVEAVLEYPEADRDEQPLIVLLVRDISERVAAEEHAQLIQHTINSVTDAVFMCDEATLEFTYVNHGAVSLHGYSRDELLAGMTPVDLAPELPPEQMQAALERLAVASDQSVRLRTLGRNKDGTTVPVDVEINWPKAARDGAPRPVMAVVRDITDQLRNEAAVKASEARFHAAFDEGPVPMAIVEITPPDRRDMVDVNQALADLYGCTREELIGRQAADLVHPDDVQPDTKQAQAIASGATVDYAHLIRGIHKDGSEIWLDRHVSALSLEGDKNKLIVHVLDVTDKIAADRALRRQQQLTAALSEIRLAMLKGSTRDEGLSLLCETAVKLLDAAGAVVLTPTGHDDEVAIAASAGVSPQLRQRMKFSTTAGGVGQVFRTGKPIQTPEAHRHPTAPTATRDLLDEHRVGPVMMAPLPAADQTVGVLAIVRLTGHEPFTDADLDAAQHLAASGVVAIELAEARNKDATLQLLEDRERIGRDMHDTVIGKLFSTGMKIQAGLSRISDPDLKIRFTTTIDDIDEAIKDIRTTIYGVRSNADWGKGVRGAILALAADQNHALGFEPTVRLDGPIDNLPEPIVNALLAVIREALTNTAKYANATTIDLTVTCTTTNLTAQIKDNGTGFDTNNQIPSSNHSGNGLNNMNTRATTLGGHATITSTPGQGTTLDWSVPLD